MYFDKLKGYSDRNYDCKSALQDIDILDKKIKEYSDESKSINKK